THQAVLDWLAQHRLARVAPAPPQQRPSTEQNKPEQPPSPQKGVSKLARFAVPPADAQRRRKPGRPLTIARWFPAVAETMAHGTAGDATNRRDETSECTSPKPLAQGPLLDSRLLRLAMRKSRACSALVSMPSNRVRAAAIPNALVQGSFHLNKEDHLKKIVPFIISGASLFLMAIYVPIFGQSQTQPASAQVAPLTDFQKEAIASIRE